MAEKMNIMDNLEHDCPLEAGCCARRRDREIIEAAKEWIKELDENPERHIDIFSEWVEGHTRPDAFLVINFIKHFFNLEEKP